MNGTLESSSIRHSDDILELQQKDHSLFDDAPQLAMEVVAYIFDQIIHGARHEEVLNIGSDLFGPGLGMGSKDSLLKRFGVLHQRRDGLHNGIKLEKEPPG